MRTRASASKGSLLLHCAHWARADAVWRDDEAGDAAAVGNAVHLLCEAWIRCHTGTHAAMIRPDDAAARCGVAPESVPRVRLLWASALDWLTTHARIGWQPERAFAWDWTTDTGRELETPGGHRDYSLATDTEITGTADCVTWDGDVLVVYDWKSGRAELDTYDGQMALLAVAAARAYGASKVRVVLVRFRDNGPPEVRERTFDALDIEEYAGTFALMLTGAADGVALPSPGPHCSAMYCPAQASCPASRALLTSHEDTAPLAELLTTAITTPEEAGRAYLLAKRAKSLLKLIDDRVQEIAAQGDVPTSGGKVLRMFDRSREYFSAERIDPLRREAMVGELRELGALKASTWREAREVKK